MNPVLRESPAASRPAATRPPERSAAGDDIDLLAYAATCWRYRYLVLGVVLVVAIVTYAVNRSITPTYEATFRLMASAPKVGDVATPTVSVTAFRELVESQSMAAAIVDEFKLNAPPHSLTAGQFLANRVSVETIPDTTIIGVSIRLTDPDLVVRVANRYAERVVELARQLNVGDAEYATRMIRQELDAAATRLVAAEAAMEEFKHRTQIELLRTDVDTLLLRRPEVLDLTVQIESERARLRQIEAELLKQDRVRQVPRSVNAVPPLEPLETPIAPKRNEPSITSPAKPGLPQGQADTRETAAATPPGQAPAEEQQKPSQRTPFEPAANDAKPLDEPQIRGELLNPYINPVYELLQRDVANSRTRLAGLEEKRKALVAGLKLGTPAAAALNRLYEAEAGLADVTREYDLARAAHKNAATRHEDARLQIAVRSARLQILDHALPPDHAVAPRVLRNTAAASLIALTLAIVAVLVFDASRSRAR
jgi:uncharacterized protein involved in exopolysaccharide biosynthesis